MAHIIADLVRETTTTTGTGNVSLAGARSPGRKFNTVMADADTCHYSIQHTSANEWEIGFGTYETTGDVFIRTSVIASSNSNAAVNFSAGTKNIDLIAPAAVVAQEYSGVDNAGNGTITMGNGGDFTLITSTTTITAFVFTHDWVGRIACIRFATARQITHNATSLILPAGGLNIQALPGDQMQVESLGGGNFRVNWYQPVNGNPIGHGLTSLTSSPSQTNSTTNIDLGSYTIPANSLFAGSDFSWEGYIYVSRGGTTTASNFVLEMLINGVVIQTITIAITTTATQNRQGRFSGRLAIRTVGGSGTCQCSLSGFHDIAGTAGAASIAMAPASATAAPGATTIDTTVSRSIQVRARTATAVANLTIYAVNAGWQRVR